MQSDLDMLLAKQPNILFIITGNFNPTTTVLHLKDLINFNHLKQMVNLKTHYTRILDWFLTNRPKHFQLTPKIGSFDHKTVRAKPLTFNLTSSGVD